MKKVLSICLAAVILISAMPFAFAAEDEKTVIWSASDLQKINYDLNGDYVLGCDIDFAGIEDFTPVGTEAKPFTGTLDGNGYCVKNLIISNEYNPPEKETFVCASLFGYIDSAEIRNLKMEKADIYVLFTGRQDGTDVTCISAGFASMVQNGSIIENCSFSGKVKAIAAYNTRVRVAPFGCCYDSVIRNCCSDGLYFGGGSWLNTMVSGIAAWAENCTIENCRTAGTIYSSNANAQTYAGGINASGSGSTVKNCASLLKELTTEGSTTTGGVNCVDVISPFAALENNITLTSLAGTAPNRSAVELSASLAANEITYQSRGWDFDNIWKPGETYPELILGHTREYITGTDDDMTISYGNTVIHCYSGILEINGTDPMTDPLSPATTPIPMLADKTDAIIIGKDVPYIEENAFDGFENVQILEIKGDTTVKAGSFSDLVNLWMVYFGGSPDIEEGAFPDYKYADVFETNGKTHTGTLPRMFFTHNVTRKDGTLYIDGEFESDAYLFFDLCALLCSNFKDVSSICFDSFTCYDIQFYQYRSNSTKLDPIFDYALTNADIRVKVADGDDWKEITWNEFCNMGLVGEIDSFRLAVTADGHEDIKDSEIEIEDGDENTGSIWSNLLKYVTSLINKIFTLFTKLTQLF